MTRPPDPAALERLEAQATVRALLEQAARARIALILASPVASLMGRELRLARSALHAVPAESEATVSVQRAAACGLVGPHALVPLQASYAKVSARPHERQGDAAIRRESVSEFTLEAKANGATEAHGIARVNAAQAATLPDKATPRAYYSNRAGQKTRIVR